jgi:hypothetical protein
MRVLVEESVLRRELRAAAAERERSLALASRKPQP